MDLRLVRKLLHSYGSVMVENMEHEEEDEERKKFYEELSKELEEDMIDVSHQYRNPYCPVSVNRGGPETCVTIIADRLQSLRRVNWTTRAHPQNDYQLARNISWQERKFGKSTEEIPRVENKSCFAL